FFPRMQHRADLADEHASDIRTSVHHQSSDLLTVKPGLKPHLFQVDLESISLNDPAQGRTYRSLGPFAKWGRKLTRKLLLAGRHRYVISVAGVGAPVRFGQAAEFAVEFGTDHVGHNR